MTERHDEPPGGGMLTFDGRPIPVRQGQSIAGALLAAGIRSWRTTRAEGRPRGLFCGIGVCFDCLVTVNGRSSLRACLVEARPGDVVAGSPGAGQGESCDP
jgi:predicted molibdopterin-dependent oxidoreductase YjgC